MITIILKQGNDEFLVKDIKYSKRVADVFKSLWIFYAIAFLAVGMMSSFMNSIYVVIFFVLLNTLEYHGWYKYHLTRIIKNGSHLKIEYLQKDISKIIEDEKERFSFEKKRVWYKIRGGPLVYLIIYYNGQIILKQYPIGDFDEKAFDFIIDNFS